MYNDPNQSPQQPYGAPPQQPYAPPQPPPKKRRVGLWIVLGIVAVLLLACVGGIFLVVNLVAHSPATAAVNSYYTALENQNYPTAYQYLDSSVITVNNQPITESLFVQAAQAVDTQKGKVTSYTITSTHLNASNGVNTGTFTVSVTRGGQSYDVHLQLKQEGSDWKIVNLDNL